MRLALNGATIMRSPLEGDIDVAAEAGYDALEIWADKLDAYLRARSLEDLREQLVKRGLAPWCINSIEDITFRDAAGRRDVLARLDRLSGVARAIGAPSIVVVPGRKPDGATRKDCVRDAVDALLAMSDVAGETSLAFEFLGKPACAVPTLDMAVEIVELAGRSNVGMVIDAFHFHAGGSSLADIATVAVERLLVVHLNGCEDLPRAELTDDHRLYPGEGVIPIGAILTALRVHGWDGVASVEIFRPEYWEQPPRQVASSAHAKAVAVLRAAGYEISPVGAPEARS
jgi:2-keto-myo-inositol isomerase